MRVFKEKLKIIIHPEMRKIGKRSKMKINVDIIYLYLRQSLSLSPFFPFLLIIFMTLIFELYSFQQKQHFNFISVLGFFLFTGAILLARIFPLKVEIDVKKRKVNVFRRLLFFQYKESEGWAKNASLQYEVQYDSDNKITAVYLIAKRNIENKKKNYLRLVEFPDLETLRDFKEIFNLQSWEVKIQEPGQIS